MYDKGFYDTIRDGTRRSAEVVVPLVLKALSRRVGPNWPDLPWRPNRVIDVGCGEGWWAQEFANHGCEVIGLDGSYVDSSPLGDRFLPHDLTLPLPPHLAGRFDLAVCLEVAEHLHETMAYSLVTDLTKLASVVLFSAAIPGQGGAGHVNEQWPNFWVELFDSLGYTASGALRWQIWDNALVENWYRQNLLVFTRIPEAFPDLYDTPLAPPWPVVHPVLFNARRH